MRLEDEDEVEEEIEGYSVVSVISITKANAAHI